MISSQQGVQSDLDTAAREDVENRTPEGWDVDAETMQRRAGENRGLFFWIVQILSIYWFILRPLGL